MSRHNERQKMSNENQNEHKDEIFSTAVKAGKRTYFLDVKTTKGNDHFITITESKKVQSDGKEFFQKHKIFLYKEDFDKFSEGLLETIEAAKRLQNNSFQQDENSTSIDIRFEDL